MQRTQEAEKERSAATQFAEKSQQSCEEEDFVILSTQTEEKDEMETMAELNVAKLPGAVKVKAVLQREGKEEGVSSEIRRFSVGEVSHKAIVTTLRSLFNIDPQRNCTLFWKDADGDMVQFSTTEELRHAMENMHDETLRIYVTVAPDVTKERNEQEAETGEGKTQDELPPSNPEPSTSSEGQRDQKEKKRSSEKHAEFHAVRQQVPESFRGWVRQYVRRWVQQGPQAANQITTLPEGAPRHFRSWLHDFLSQWVEKHGAVTSSGPDADKEMEEGVKVDEGVVEVELMSAPEGLPPLYYRWICLFLPRFYRCCLKRRESSGEMKGQGQQSHSGGQGRACQNAEGHRCCHGKKEKKKDGHSSSSESEDTDSDEKKWKKVPKEFRKYVRVSVREMHKDKGDDSKVKEEATRAGLSPEVLEFVQQILLEWHAKLSHKRPRDIAKEMKEGGRTLPTGMERDHFLWLCRFMVRWHRRHAGKSDVMSGWSSGETSEDTSAEEGKSAQDGHPGHAGPRRARHGHHPHFCAQPYFMHGCPPPPPPPVFSCMTPPLPPHAFMRQGHMRGFGARPCFRKFRGQGWWMNQHGATSCPAAEAKD